MDFFTKKYQVASVVLKDNDAFRIVFRTYQITDKFVVFTDGTVHNADSTKSVHYEQMLIATDSIFTITIV